MFRNVFRVLVASFFVLFAAQTSFANMPMQVSSYKELLTALTNGYDVRAIIDLNKCTFKSLKGRNIDRSLLVSLNFNRFIKSSDVNVNGIVAADSFTVDSPSAGVSIFYVQLKVDSNNQTEVIGEYIDRQTSTVLAQGDFNCELSTRADGKAVKLFNTNS